MKKSRRSENPQPVKRHQIIHNNEKQGHIKNESPGSQVRLLDGMILTHLRMVAQNATEILKLKYKTIK